MSKEFLKIQRPREELILDFKTKTHVKGEIVQYLASHQISGLRFLYKNYKNNKSCFLNDENGLGKTFQLVAFLSAVCDGMVNGMNVLILCQNFDKLLHWHYHCSVLLPNIKTIVADNRQFNADTKSKCTASCIVLSSMDNALKHLNELKKNHYRFVIVHDEQLEVNFDALVKLRTALISDDSRKVIVCSADMLANTRYFYGMLKFCDLRLPLFIDESKQFLNFNEFSRKFGGAGDRSTSKRNLIFRQKNLLNVCHDFYLRRFHHQVGGIGAKEIYDKCFNQWKTSQAEIEETAIESNWFDDDMEMPSSQRETTKKSVSSEQIIDPIVTNRCDDYESEMSPLVYHGSESDADNNESVDTITGTPTENVTSTYSKQRISNIKETLNSDNTSEDNTRILRSQQLKRRLRSSDTKHQSKPNSIDRKTLSKTKKKSKSNQRNVKATEKSEQSTDSCCSSTTTTTTTSTTKSSIVSYTRKKDNTLKWSQDTCASDIQLMQEDNMTPITISSSADTIIASQSESMSNTNFTTQSFQASPDIFGSFTEQTEAASIACANSSPSTSPIPAGQSRFVDNQSEFDGSQTICTQDIFVESQGIVNTTNPIQALNTTTSDIFEITRNNVFHNVLKVNNADAMTPVENSENVISTKSCFSGVRLILPRLKSDEILELQREVAQRATNSQTVSSEDLIDLTAESQLNEVINSEDTVAMVNVEATPHRKRPLTPTTRSCVKRSSDEIYISSDDEAPSTRSGWLSKRTSNVTSPHATPRSRRRLDKWFPNTINSNKASKCTQSILQPRNIFEKRRPKQIEHLQANSRSMLESPSIFSSDDE